MKLQISPDWLRRKLVDNNDENCEAGVLNPYWRPDMNMRAKLQVGFVQEHFYGEKDADGKPTKSQETLSMHAVAAGTYADDGSDENNTYAKWSPGASLQINIANPALWGQFKVGDCYYVDFTPTDK